MQGDQDALMAIPSIAIPHISQLQGIRVSASAAAGLQSVAQAGNFRGRRHVCQLELGMQVTI